MLAISPGDFWSLSALASSSATGSANATSLASTGWRRIRSEQNFRFLLLNYLSIVFIMRCKFKLHLEETVFHIWIYDINLFSTSISNKLQVFKTELRGWGIRTLCDIPRGGFICIYVGNLYSNNEANKVINYQPHPTQTVSSSHGS
jgi:hypothetical protein